MKTIGLLLGLVVLLTVSACETRPADIDSPDPLAVQANNDPCVQDTLNHVPPEYSRCNSVSQGSSVQNVPLQNQTQLLCSNARGYSGSAISCLIPAAYCVYRPDVNGSPTFCNDRPYPSNNFQLVAWGSDWSDYDGKCIVISGMVSMYSGKAQITGYSRSQVSYCQ